jgi:hypothetical protein
MVAATEGGMGRPGWLVSTTVISLGTSTPGAAPKRLVLPRQQPRHLAVPKAKGRGPQLL